MTEYISVTVFLMICAAFDIKSKRLPWWLLGFGGALALALLIMRGAQWSDLLSLIPGVLFTLVSALNSKAFGWGDTCLVYVLGIAIGLWNSVGAVLIALLLTAVTGGIWALIRHLGRGFSLPFSPFLLAGEVVVWIMSAAS